MTTPTLGAQRVRLNFNPNTNTVVNRIRRVGDVATAALVHVRVGTGTPAYVIREPFPDRPHTEPAATAWLTRFARQSKEVAMSENPALASETVLVLRGWPEAGDSQWTVLRAEHTLSKQSGYVTSVTAEPTG